MDTSLFYLSGAYSAISFTIGLIPAVLSIIGLWKVFTKAGEPGWAAIVPFYNNYVLFKIVWGNGWLFLLLFIPVGNIVVICVTMYQLAKRFGKSTGFGVGMIFLDWLFLFLLGMEKPQVTYATLQDAYGNPYTQQYIVNGYQGPRDTGKKGMIIGSVITGVVGTILLILIIAVAGYMISSAISDYDTTGTFIEEELEPTMDDIVLPDEEPTSDLSDIGSDGKYRDMAALADIYGAEIREAIGDDSGFTVNCYGKQNILYLELTYEADIPEASFDMVASALSGAMGPVMEEALDEVADLVSCDDPTLVVTVVSNDGKTLWTDTYSK